MPPPVDRPREVDIGFLEPKNMQKIWQERYFDSRRMQAWANVQRRTMGEIRGAAPQ
jgi:hypothetical protein